VTSGSEVSHTSSPLPTELRWQFGIDLSFYLHIFYWGNSLVTSGSVVFLQKLYTFWKLKISQKVLRSDVRSLLTHTSSPLPTELRWLLFLFFELLLSELCYYAQFWQKRKLLSVIYPRSALSLRLTASFSDNFVSALCSAICSRWLNPLRRSRRSFRVRSRLRKKMASITW